MDNRISMLSIYERKSAFISHAQHQIREVALRLYPDADAFEVYENTGELMRGLSAAFSHCETVILGVDCSLYLNLKKLLIQVLVLEGEQSRIIAETIAEKNEDDFGETLIDAHALIPKGAKTFLSEDGLFSGFALKSGKQHLIVLPLDAVRTDSIITNGFYEYLRQLTDGLQKPIQPVTKDNTLPKKTADALAAAGLKVAAAGTKTSSFLHNTVKAVASYENVFAFFPGVKERGALTQKEYVAALAGEAREKTGYALGCAISNVFISEKDKGRFFVFVALVDSTRARVAKVFGEPGETPRILIDAAVETLLTMIGDYAVKGGFDSDSPASPVEEFQPPPPEEKKSKKRLALMILLYAAAAVILCVAVSFLVKSSSVKAFFKNYYGAGSMAAATSATASTTAPTTQAAVPAGVSEDDIDLIKNLARAPSYTVAESTTAESASPDGSTQTEKPATAYQTESRRPASTTRLTTVRNTTTARPPSIVTTTTKPPVQTTTRPPATAGTQAPDTKKTGTFTFTVSGYGHGVGMSQEGAKAFARQGKTYDYILLHYYYHENMRLVDDPSPPNKVKYGGNEIDLHTYLARTTAKEINASSPLEALKAQVVAVYTYAKYYGFDVNAGQHAYDTGFNVTGESNVMKAVREVAGKYLSFEGKVAMTPYFASCAGRTVSSQSVWGGTVPYLAGGRTSPETVSTTTKTFTSQEIKEKVDAYNASNGSAAITLPENPADWLKIISKDSVGYVNTIQIGDRQMRGNAFRSIVLNLGIRSHCFTYTYKPD